MLFSHKKTSSPGFTLLEVMIAVAIIAISFVSLLGSQSQSISIAGISRFETTAALLARKKMTELQLMAFDQLNNSAGQFEDEFTDYSWQADVRELNEDETGIPDTDNILKLITLQIGRDGDENQVFTVRSVIMTDIEPAKEK